MTLSGDLTIPSGWDERHKDHHFDSGYLLDGRDFSWLPSVLAHLKAYSGGTFLELGCVPGRISALICGSSNIGLQPVGVDYCSGGHLYLRSLSAVGISGAVYHNSDLRAFYPNRSYDIVASFGLIEHFKNVDEILSHHSIPLSLVIR